MECLACALQTAQANNQLPLVPTGKVPQLGSRDFDLVDTVTSSYLRVCLLYRRHIRRLYTITHNSMHSPLDDPLGDAQSGLGLYTYHETCQQCIPEIHRIQPSVTR